MRLFHPLILIFCTILVGSKSLRSQDYQKIKKIQGELISSSLQDTALINRYVLLATEYRGKNKDSALVWINKAIKLCLQTKNNNAYDDALYLKATIYYFSGDFKSSKNLQMMSLKQAKRNNDKIILSKNYNLLGAIEYNAGNYKASEKYYNLKLQTCIQLKDTSSIIETYYNISLIYQTLGDFEKSIDYNFRILRLAQTYKNEEAIMLSSQGLAEAYTKVKNYPKSYEFLRKAKEIAIKINDTYSLSGIYIDEGNILMEQNKAALAIEIFEKSIQLCKKYQDKYHLSVALNGKVSALLHNKEFVRANEYAQEAITINIQLDRKQGLVTAYSMSAECQFYINHIPQALAYGQKALYYAKQIQSLEDLKSVYGIMYMIYDKVQNSDSSLKYFRLYSIYKDSINLTDQTHEMARQELLFEKLKSDQKTKHQMEISNAKIQKQTQIRNISIVFAVLVLIVLAFLFKNYKAKNIANAKITKQKAIIEQKNQDITDSINYSKRIQQAILTPVQEVKALLPHSFVYFKPKDIVSGDFYFIEPVISKEAQWIAVALADCTGHGVPGAFMSIMGYNFLKQSLKQPEIYEPAQALDFVNKELHGFLRFNSAQQTIRDGMDIAFCAINKTNLQLLYAGANNPVWIIFSKPHFNTLTLQRYKVLKEWDDKIMIELLADKQHIGFNEKINSFNLHTVQLEKGCQLYLFTDGFADQFGGPKHKKFKYSTLQNLIANHSTLEMDQQLLVLDKTFNEWKGSHEQVDDVSLIGIKV